MRGTTVLLVEDHDTVRRRLQQGLDRLGYSTAVAANTHDARLLLLNGRFDLVVSDLRLPDGDGLELLAFSRTLKDPPVFIMITGFSSVHTAVESMKGGAFDYLEKPCTADDIHAKVKQMVLPHEADSLTADLTAVPTSFDASVDRLRATLVRKALEAAQGNKTEAAKLLGMKRSTFLDTLRRVETIESDE